MREAAWPSIRADLGLSYTAIGVLLTVPVLVSGCLEPLLALLGDSPRRGSIVAAGGVAFAGALMITAAAGNFGALLVGFVILYPASGAFVSLSQATLMDLDPPNRDRNMARWTLAGSVGLVLGPIALAGATALGWGWRAVLVALAVTTIPLTVRSRPAASVPGTASQTLRGSLAVAWAALHNGRVVRWLVLVHVTDLLGDVFAGFIAVYFIDVVHASFAGAALAVVVWTVGNLVGDALLVPLLGRASGPAYLRVSATATSVVYPCLLVIPGAVTKLILLGALGVISAGWYAIPQARLYAELHGNSGVALALTNITGLVAGLSPLAIGILAERFGLNTALWACLLAPAALWLLLPRERDKGGANPPSADAPAGNAR